MSDLLLGPGGRTGLRGLGAVVLVFLLAPVLVLVPLSLSGDNTLLLPPTTWSSRWFENLVDQPRWRDALWLSIVTALASATVATVLGTLGAIALQRLSSGPARVVRLLFLAPLIVPLMVIAVGFYVSFASVGIVGRWVSLPVAHAVLGIPFVVLTVLARLATLDGRIERAAASLGADELRILTRVLLPRLWPAAAAGFLLAFMTSFDEVIVAQFLTGPRLETLPRRMWEGLAIGGLDNTITAIATLQIAVVAAVLAGTEYVLGRDRRRPEMVKDAPATPATQKRREPVAGGRGVPIRFEGLSKSYGRHVAVDDVSFEVGAGEFLTILGPSGSGKTTLLMLVAGFLEPDAGRLLIGSTDVSRLSPHRRDIGIVFQSYALFPHLSVFENVAFPLRARRIAEAEVRRQVGEVLSLVRLEGFADRGIHELSGGQQQRVAFARAVVFEPRALLMDEPLAALDRNLRLDMQSELRALQRAVGHTTLYVTHDQEEALNLSDRIAVMDGGRLQQIGTPTDLYDRPSNRFVAGFFGEANLIDGQVSSGLFRADSLDMAVPAPTLRDGRATACLRPEAVVISDRGRHAGVVTQAVFAGSLERLVMRSGHIVLRAARTTGPTGMPEPGSAVAFDVETALVHVMEAEQ